MCGLTVCRGQVGGWSSRWVVQRVGVKWVCGPSVCGWSKCVAKVCVCVCGLSVCRGQVVGGQVGGWSSEWVVKLVGGQLGGWSSGWGQVGVWHKCVCVFVPQVCVCVA